MRLQRWGHAFDPRYRLTTAKPGAPPGTYRTQCWGAFDPSYTFTYVAGTLTINQAPLTIHAANATAAVGSPLPRLRWKARFVNHDTPASLRKQPSCRAPKLRVNPQGEIVSPAGVYRIRCSGARDPNYRIRYASGRLTVAMAPARVVYDGPLSVTRRADLRLSARLTSSAAVPIRGRRVTFSVGPRNDLQTCSGMTNRLGLAACRIRHPSLIRAGSQRIRITFHGDGKAHGYDYGPAMAWATVSVV